MSQLLFQVESVEREVALQNRGDVLGTMIQELFVTTTLEKPSLQAVLDEILANAK